MSTNPVWWSLETRAAGPAARYAWIASGALVLALALGCGGSSSDNDAGPDVGAPDVPGDTGTADVPVKDLVPADQGPYDPGSTDEGPGDPGGKDLGPSDVGPMDADAAGDAGTDAVACPAGAFCGGTYNRVFVTSTKFLLSDLGVTGADTACNKSAQAASLPGTYSAWISGATSDAKTRLGSASGWLRTDFRPFAASQADLLAGHILYPPYLDEFGSPGASTSGVSVGTNADGTVADQNCLDWTVKGPTDHVTSGYSFAGNAKWTSGGLGQCNLESPIYCLGVDYDGGIPVAPVSGRVAFATAGRFTPDGGLTGADALCQSEAVAASLPGTYKALLGTTSASPISRFSTAGATWVRVDGLPVWDSAADAAAGEPPLAPFLVQADGGRATSGWAWAGSQSLVAPGTLTCQDWTTILASEQAHGASTFYAYLGWIGLGPVTCDRTVAFDARLICLQE